MVDVEGAQALDQANNLRLLLGIACVVAGIGFALVKLWTAKFMSKWAWTICALMVMCGVILMNWQVYA